MSESFRGNGAVLCPSSRQHVGVASGDQMVTSPYHLHAPPDDLWGTAHCGRCGQVVSCEPFDSCVTFHPHFTTLDSGSRA